MSPVVLLFPPLSKICDHDRILSVESSNSCPVDRFFLLLSMLFVMFKAFNNQQKTNWRNLLQDKNAIDQAHCLFEDNFLYI